MSAVEWSSPSEALLVQELAPIAIEWHLDSTPAPDDELVVAFLIIAVQSQVRRFANEMYVPRTDTTYYRVLARRVADRAILVIGSVRLGARAPKGRSAYFYRAARGYVRVRKLSRTLNLTHGEGVAIGGNAPAIAVELEDGEPKGGLGSHLCAAFEDRSINQFDGSFVDSDACVARLWAYFVTLKIVASVQAGQPRIESFDVIPDDLASRLSAQRDRFPPGVRPHCLVVGFASTVTNEYLVSDDGRHRIRFTEPLSWLGVPSPRGPLVVLAACRIDERGRPEFWRGYAVPIVARWLPLPAESRVERWLTLATWVVCSEFLARFPEYRIELTKPLYGRGLDDTQEQRRAGHRVDILLRVFRKAVDGSSVEKLLGELLLEFNAMTRAGYFGDKIRLIRDVAPGHVIVVVDAVGVLGNEAMECSIEFALRLTLREWLFGVRRGRVFEPGVLAVVPRWSPYRSAVRGLLCS